MIVSKAPVLVPQSRKKPLTSSQEVLFTLLNKRFQRYLHSTHTDNGRKNNPLSDVAQESPTVSVTDCPSPGVGVEGVANKTSTLTDEGDNVTLGSTLEDMECQELAERVVNQAKVKLRRRRSKARRFLFKDDSSKKPFQRNSPKKVPPEGVSKPLLEYRKLPSPYSVSSLRTNPVRKTIRHSETVSNFPVIPQSPPSLIQSPRKTPSLVQSPSKSPSLAQSPHKTPLTQSPSYKTAPLSPCRTVYLSEPHSITPKQTGIPNAPPSSPGSVFASSHNYIQPLCDAKSQRQLKSQLQDIVILRGRQEAAANREMELERKRKKREEVVRLKTRQRAEIYALNEVMKKFEEEKFREFISGRV